MVTYRSGHVDKCAEDVDNPGGRGKSVRTTALLTGMSRGRTVGGGKLCVDWHNPGPVGMTITWGDVDRLSTRYQAENSRHRVR
jgi:hypothetical protein